MSIWAYKATSDKRTLSLLNWVRLEWSLLREKVHVELHNAIFRELL